MIEEGLPIPPRKYCKRPTKWKFNEMKVGDSIYMPGIENGHAQARIFEAKKRGCTFKFTTRTIDGGVRVWRIE